jgi:hypothetical protein
MSLELCTTSTVAEQAQKLNDKYAVHYGNAQFGENYLQCLDTQTRVLFEDIPRDGIRTREEFLSHLPFEMTNNQPSDGNIVEVNWVYQVFLFARRSHDIPTKNWMLWFPDADRREVTVAAAVQTLSHKSWRKLSPLWAMMGYLHKLAGSVKCMYFTTLRLKEVHPLVLPNEPGLPFVEMAVACVTINQATNLAQSEFTTRLALLAQPESKSLKEEVENLVGTLLDVPWVGTYPAEMSPLIMQIPAGVDTWMKVIVFKFLKIN